MEGGTEERKRRDKGRKEEEREAEAALQKRSELSPFSLHAGYLQPCVPVTETYTALNPDS